MPGSDKSAANKAAMRSLQAHTQVKDKVNIL